MFSSFVFFSSFVVFPHHFLFICGFFFICGRNRCQPNEEGTCNFKYFDIKVCKVSTELQLIILKRYRVIIKCIRGIGNPNIILIFHNFIC